MEKSQENLKIFIIAGEPSGDVLAAKLMKQIKQQSSKKVDFIGLGGSKMQEQGLNSIFSISELSIMGFAEIVPHIPHLLKRINQTAKKIISSKADIVITVDSPGFCFRVIKKLNQNNLSKNIKKVHLIAPSVWAYNESRAEKISKLYNLLLAVLPFEPPYFEKYGLKTVFIGHPITENNFENASNDFRQKHKIDKDKLLLCLTPGSRVSEVKRMIEPMIGAANILSQKYPDLTVAIATISKTKQLAEESAAKFKSPVIIASEEEKISLLKASNVAIAKSGTNTLELAIAKLPMIVTYKANYLTFLIIKMMSKIKFANLINIILNREAIPEFIQTTCKDKILANAIDNLISNPKLAQNQIEESALALKILGLNSPVSPSCKAASEILKISAK
jgi:lipid-A-disaccharide synthase